MKGPEFWELPLILWALSLEELPKESIFYKSLNDGWITELLWLRDGLCCDYNSPACLQDSFSIPPSPASCPRGFTLSDEKARREWSGLILCHHHLGAVSPLVAMMFHTCGSPQVAHLSCSSSHQVPISIFLPFAPSALREIMASFECQTQNPLFISSILSLPLKPLRSSFLVIAVSCGESDW